MLHFKDAPLPPNKKIVFSTKIYKILTIKKIFLIPFPGLLELLNSVVASYPRPLMRYWLGPKLYVLIRKPEDMQTVLNAPECLNRDDVYKYVTNLAGNGLVALPGNYRDQCIKNIYFFKILILLISVETWKEHRKYLNPTFSLKILQSYMPIFNKESHTLTNRLKDFIRKPAFDIYRFMDACTLDIVCRKFSNYTIL